MQVMGVVNVTPDSFSDGGRYLDHGGRARPRPSRWWPRAPTGSTSAASRPGPAPSRWPRPRSCAGWCPWSRRWPPQGVAVSIDTRKAEVAEAAVAAGATHGQRRPAGARTRWPPPPASAWSPCTCRATRARCRTTPATTTSWPRCATSSWPGPSAAAAPRASPRCGSTRASASARRSTTTSPCCAHLDELVATGLPGLVGTSRKALLGTLAARAEPGGAAAPGRPARGVAGHRGVGPLAGRGDGAGPRRGRHRAGLDAVEAWRPGRLVATSMRETSRGTDEGQVGPGHHPAQLRVGAQGPARRVRAPGRLRREPPPGPPPGGDHLDP